jgi:GGDEF domain-containing protein
LSWFTEVARSLAVSFDAVVMMVDGKGTLLTRQPSRESWVGRQFADHPIIRAMLASPEGVVTGDSLDGVRRVFGFVELPGTGARLAVGFDESDILRRVNREIFAAAAGLGLLSAIVLIGIWFGGERLFVEPIRALTRTAQRFGQGEYNVRAAETARVAEFIPLAAALDDMAGQLAAREQELRDTNRQLRELVDIDALTGIANRRAFNARLAAEWRLAAELVQPLAVLLVDVDHFKLFNDHYGHIQGDVCLRQLSEVLKSSTRIRSDAAPHVMGPALPPSFRNFVGRDSDFAARYGGEEFALLLQGAGLDAAIKVAERLRRTVEELRIVHEQAPNGVVTISIGVASVVPAKDANAQQLIELADAGLYEAKRGGRNLVVAHAELTLSKAS